VAITPSYKGFLLLDGGCNLVAANDAALQILCFPRAPDQIKQPKAYITERVRTTLVEHRNRDGRPAFVREFMSGKRHFFCKSFQINCNPLYPVQPVFAVLLERHAVDSPVLGRISEQYDLTPRERETVEYLLQGLTSKEIANRMNISPNTVKAFLRLVMVKMKVSTRSGIAGIIAGAKSAA
jgi:DNA-binding CsgD family transcriptional regulator